VGLSDTPLAGEDAAVVGENSRSNLDGRRHAVLAVGTNLRLRGDLRGVRVNRSRSQSARGKVVVVFYPRVRILRNRHVREHRARTSLPGAL
jgi:hypothetical protein